MYLQDFVEKMSSCGVLTGHYEHEPANISSLAADRQNRIRRDVLKRLGMDGQVFLGNILSP
jgi:hypothetical protein